MATVSLKLSTQGNISEGPAIVERYEHELTSSWIDATQDSIDFLKGWVEFDLVRIAHGGPYWDVEADVTRTGTGAIGVVKTPPSKPHLIEPRDKKVLHFEVDGESVFTKLVHHPGSNPPDWVADMPEGATESIRQIFRDKVREVSVL